MECILVDRLKILEERLSFELEHVPEILKKVKEFVCLEMAEVPQARL